MRTGRIAAAAGAAMVLAVVGVYAATSGLFRPGDAFSECRESAVAGGDIGGPFTLVDGTGATVTDAEVVTEPTLLYFGYTYCPDVCPLDNARNADAIAILRERGIDAQSVFISIDPARDTPEVMSQYVANFGDDMVGLTGSDEQIAEAARAYRVFYQKQAGDDPDYYLMNHSAFSYIVLPEAGFVDFVRREDEAEAVADRMACFAAAEN